MPEQIPNDNADAFERRFADLLSEYARAANEPFDAVSIAAAAAEAAPSLRPWTRPVPLFGPSLRAAWVLLLLLGLMATLAGGAIVLGTPPAVPAPPPAYGFAPDELLLVTGRDQIVAVTISTGERRVVVEGGGALMAVSPDRTRLARVPQPWAGRHPVGGNSFIVTDARGRDLAQVPYGAGAAAWSPDGRYIAFNHRSEAGPPGGGGEDGGLQYSVWDTSTGAVTRLLGLTQHTGSTPSWAPDSRHVLLPTDRGLVISDLDGEMVQTIPGTDGDSVGSWSPDGAHILHEHGIWPGWGQQQFRNGYLELLAVGSGFSTEVVTRFEPYLANPSWSPDGRMVAGTSLDDGVTVVSLDDLSEFRVVYSRERMGSDWTVYVMWSPDGQRLAFRTWDPATGKPAVFGADATGGEATVLMPLDDWNPVDW